MLRNDLSADVIRAALDYDPITGTLTWKLRTDRRKAWNTQWAGRPAGFVQKVDGGYVRAISWGRRRKYLAHRIIWVWVTGLWPLNEIDHKDRNPLNNTWNNLRCATRPQNCGNTKPKTNLPKGVSCKKGRYYVARLKINYKEIYLGCYKTPSEAHEAYKEAAREAFGEFARFTE